MEPYNNPDLTKRAQELRKNMTDEERFLWHKLLKKLPQTVNRQKVFENYIVDFYCSEAKIVIELDGSQHYSSEGKVYDKKRDEYFKEKGILVLRYPNTYVHKNFEYICNDILRNIKERSE